MRVGCESARKETDLVERQYLNDAGLTPEEFMPKWETPEQFKERTGKEWTDTWRNKTCSYGCVYASNECLATYCCGECYAEKVVPPWCGMVRKYAAARYAARPGKRGADVIDYLNKNYMKILEK